jgi:hypothetical protein
MEGNFDPFQEGLRIAREYLSKKVWASEWRHALNTQLYPAVEREELEAKERQVDGTEESAEEFFSREYDKWRKDTSPEAKEVLRGIYELLGQRHDLGFIAKRIIDRIKVTLTSE